MAWCWLAGSAISGGPSLRECALPALPVTASAAPALRPPAQASLCPPEAAPVAEPWSKGEAVQSPAVNPTVPRLWEPLGFGLSLRQPSLP